MVVLKWFGYLILAVLVLVGVVFVAARFHDGPLSMIPGGALKSGPLLSEAINDWRFARDVQTIEMQLKGDSTSRTTWILVLNGTAYIPASLSFPPGKTWHKHADKNGAAIVRIRGNRYPVDMRRVSDPAVITALKAAVQNKYGAATPAEGAGVWFFRLSSRAV